MLLSLTTVVCIERRSRALYSWAGGLSGVRLGVSNRDGLYVIRFSLRSSGDIQYLLRPLSKCKMQPAVNAIRDESIGQAVSPANSTQESCSVFVSRMMLKKLVWIGIPLASCILLAAAAPSHALVTPQPASVRGGAVKIPRNPFVARKAETTAAAPQESGGGTATIPNEVFNLVKSIVGAGVLSLPYGVAVFGNHPSALVPGVALIAIMGAISAYTFGIIGRVCQNTKTESYSDAWDATVGKSTAALIAFSCLFDCFAGNLSYSMILADTVSNLAASAGVALTRTQSLLSVVSQNESLRTCRESV